ncbi:hypothetical protein NEOLEDRAFT_214160 [Neolentinus lepideus HHB14362 ss-1]|uniref:Uncharacterized protein n=1 Tax=Neolentinus lepideus HHB14362 ss-1 TaxID=1314782 RepID=A0A165TL72_9AGAM|nr:hypothetical protein NEOLEDRAFT_214160 [Neolentinus lepideus HHB14362 ss-1]
MPGLTRRFSDCAGEADTVVAVDGFPNSRVSSSINPNGVDGLPHLHRPKRRRTFGLNDRFDNMIRRVSLMDSSSPSNSSQRKRQRVSSGSSSAPGSTSDIPSTPLDAYTDLSNGRLGRGFSVIKMDTSTGKRVARELFPRKNVSSDDADEIGLNVDRESKTHNEAPPSWLSATISTLRQDHPLRLLLPKSSTHIHVDPSHTPDLTQEIPKLPSVQDNESVFAFVPPDDIDVYPEKTFAVDGFRQEPVSGGISSIVQRRSSRAEFVSDIVDVEDASILDPSDPLHAASPYKPTLSTDFLSVESDNLRMLRDLHSTSLSFEELPYSMPGHLATESPMAATVFRSRLLAGPDLYRNAADFSLTCDSQPMSIVAVNNIEEDTEYNYTQTLDDMPPNNDDIHIDTDAFSTPGPTYVPPPGIYFDSPAEDPLHSDPIDPADYHLDLDVDYETLDFRWEPFFPKGSASSEPDERREEEPSSQKLGHDICSSPNSKDLALQIGEDLPIEQEIKEDVVSDAGMVANELDEPDEGVAEILPRTPEPQKQVFAPAPDVFISPLHGDDKPDAISRHGHPRSLKGVLDARDFGQEFVPTATITPPPVASAHSRRSLDGLSNSNMPAVALTKSPCVEEQNTGPICSQASNDSIESWTTVEK